MYRYSKRFYFLFEIKVNVKKINSNSIWFFSNNKKPEICVYLADCGSQLATFFLFDKTVIIIFVKNSSQKPFLFSYLINFFLIAWKISFIWQKKIPYLNLTIVRQHRMLDDAHECQPERTHGRWIDLELIKLT